MKKSLIMSIIVLIVTVVVTVTAVFAWFVGNGSPSDTLVEYSGDIDLNVGVFRGLDNNRDGVLNEGVLDGEDNVIYPEATSDPLTGESIPKSARSTITSYLYSEIDRETGTTYEEYISGTGILLKVLVENPTDAASDAKVALCLSNLSQYFYEAAGQSEETVNTLMRQYTARIMFKVENITARCYTKDGVNNNFTSGYNTMSGSSVNGEYGNEIRQISSLNTYGKTTFYLWEISENQKFIENVEVKKGELLELDFKLSCMQTDEIYAGYDAYWKGYIEVNDSLTTEEIAHINSMYVKELAYLVSEDNDNIELNFSIEKIYIYGEQIPNE